MIIGVISFYFVISDINTIISNSVAKGMKLSSRLTKLEKIRQQYILSPQLCQKARVSIFQPRAFSEESSQDWFLAQFPKSLQNQLKFHIYSKLFSFFDWTLSLSPTTLSLLGDVVHQVQFEESGADQTLPCTSRTTLPRTSTSCWTASS